MAVPKKRTSPSRRDQRRANHDKVAAPQLVPCSNCEELTMPHRMCPACGHYKGREVVAITQE
jgi:large subunit ribosomal protein L32